MCWVLNANLAAVLVPSKHVLFETSMLDKLSITLYIAIKQSNTDAVVQ